MAGEDADRWNRRYATGRYSDQPREFLIKYSAFLPSTGRALDIAMGTGANAGFLINHGLDVYGVDISFNAVLRAKKDYPELKTYVADLTRSLLPQGNFDLILNFYYLQRELITLLSQHLKPGGLVYLETLTRDMLRLKPNIPSEYLLWPGELLNLFHDWEILVYRETPLDPLAEHPKAAAGLVARWRGVMV